MGREAGRTWEGLREEKSMIRMYCMKTIFFSLKNGETATGNYTATGEATHRVWPMRTINTDFSRGDRAPGPGWALKYILESLQYSRVTSEHAGSEGTVSVM